MCLANTGHYLGIEVNMQCIQFKNSSLVSGSGIMPIQVQCQCAFNLAFVFQWRIVIRDFIELRMANFVIMS